MRATLLVLVVSLAGLALADDSTSRPAGRDAWTNAYREFERADRENGHVLREISTVRGRLTDADVKLAPLFAIEADLSSRVAPNDPRLAEARLRIHERVLELKVGEDRVKLIQLHKQELETREAAITKGDVAFKALEAHLAFIKTVKVARPERIAEAEQSLADLMKTLDALEAKGSEPVSPFTPLSNPTSLKQLRVMIAFYEEEHRRTLELATTLGVRLKEKARQLERLQNLEIRDARRDEMIKRLESRVEGIDGACQAATKRSEALRAEIARLQNLKAEEEARIHGKPAEKDGEKK